MGVDGGCWRGVLDSLGCDPIDRPSGGCRRGRFGTSDRPPILADPPPIARRSPPIPADLPPMVANGGEWGALWRVSGPSPSARIGRHRDASGGRWWWASAPPPSTPTDRGYRLPSGSPWPCRNQAWNFFFFSAKPMGLTTYAPREKLEFFSDRADSPADLTPRGGILPKSVVIFFAGVIFWKKPVIFDKKGQ